MIDYVDSTIWNAVMMCKFLWHIKCAVFLVRGFCNVVFVKGGSSLLEFSKPFDSLNVSGIFNYEELAVKFIDD